MEAMKKEILKIWKEADEWQEQEIVKLCKEFNVNPKPIAEDEYFSVYEFENGNQFHAPNDTSFDDLTGAALKFSEKRYRILDNTYVRVNNALKKLRLEKIDSEEYYTTYLKDGYEYTIPHYVTNEDDIEIEKDVTK